MLDILIQNVNGCRKDNKKESKFVMENGPKDPFLEAWVSEHTKNGVVAPVTTKFPGGNDAINQQEKVDYEVPKINGDSTNITNIEENSYSSESDALVINESDNKQESSKSQLYENLAVIGNSKETVNSANEAVTHSNPYFNESLFELSQLHQNNQEEVVGNNTDPKFEKSVKKLKKKVKPKQRITEYAQYLGLQPSVQFKCFKCNRAGFESLPSLQEHLVQCDEENVQEVSQDNNYSGFKLTRKVFLCSACGTYYENWNLYIHMLEFHKRFICLYCLGMFSILEDLCQHIQSRHNLEPGYKNTLDEFFNVYNEPCYLACCECDKLFSEQDNFFYHHCTGKNKIKKQSAKQLITPENHITGESETVVEDTRKETENPENTQVMAKCTMPENTTNDVIENEKHKEEEVDTTDTNIVKSEETEENSCSSKENNLSDKMFKEQNDLLEHLNHNNRMSPEGIHSPNLSIGHEDTNNFNDNYDTSSNKSTEQNYFNDIQVDEEDDSSIKDEHEEFKEDTRKVPKLSLKLPKFDVYEADPEDSNDSEKLTMEVDQIESEYENEVDNSEETQPSKDQEPDTDVKEEPSELEDNLPKRPTPQIAVAGPDTAIIELQLEQPLDKFDPRVLLQKCLKMTAPTCIYCNHARKISVNGKQLGLHCIAEHRFSAVVNSITAEELIPENFVNRIMENLEELSTSFFSLESSFSDEAITFSHGFECFQCHFSTTVHKEHYLHNRRFHSKSLLLCIMCKSNFYTYSELVCHLCPGVYILDYELKFKCCMCVHDDLPSSFRLMVHLRKKHNVCDVCLDSCHTQHRLSNHVWKHKLHHFCYRCAIAYRNKSDIQRHLFWKHGTESVPCKKCLQRKWRHVYHFCVPPASFSCDECGVFLRSAVALKVHKRLHTNEKKHSCTFEGCEEKFISKKLLEKHMKRHLEPPEEPKVEEKEPVVEETKEEVNTEEEPKKEEEKVEEKPKQKIDVLEDLPALNLSESDSSSDSEAEPEPQLKPEPKPDPVTELEPPGDLPPLDILQQDKPTADYPMEEISNIVMQNIWDNFKNYQQQQHKLDTMFGDQEKIEDIVDSYVEKSDTFIIDVIMRDHNYCAQLEDVPKDTAIVEVKPALNESVDHDYCFSKKPEIEEEKEEPVIEQPKEEPPKVETKQEKKPGSSSSSSSSDSDSSTCSCGSNCSCSSSSGSSSSSSDSSSSESSSEEGKKRQLARKVKRKERAKKLKEGKEKATKVDVVATDAAPVIVETPIRESDLETTESDTDEEFYDVAPHLLAKKILEEKRQQLLELMGPNSIPNGSFIESTSRPPTPPPEAIEQEQEEKRKKKSKSKKKKKRKMEKKPIEVSEETTHANNIISPDIPIPPYYQQFHQQIQQQQLQEQQQQIQPPPLTVAPITLTIPKSSPISSPSASVSTPVQLAPYPKVQTESLYSRQDSATSESNLRASKRRRVPNKFYGYSSDEEQEKPAPKWRKTETPQTPRSPLVVPPITIRAQPTPPPQPTIEPISIRTGTHLSDFRVQRPRPKPSIPPIRLLGSRNLGGNEDSESDSNDSSSEEPSVTPKPSQPQLYCYCRCPYDEVSEMIGCDATDCEIEWFHFECVGIMVPPKGQWFCPNCRKKKARKELMASMKSN